MSISQICRSCKNELPDSQKEMNSDKALYMYFNRSFICESCDINRRIEELEHSREWDKRAEREKAACCQYCGARRFYQGSSSGDHCTRHCAGCTGCHPRWKT